MINIPISIWTKSYKLKNLKSVSFIENIKTGNNYILSGAISDLWQFIINSSNYNDIREFSIKNEQESILDSFLSELKENGLINTDISLQTNKSNYLFKINRNADNFELFSNKRRDLIISNDYLGHIDLNLNYTCNLNCKHCCNIKDLNQYEINFENAKSIIDEAYNLGIFSVTLTGGECTICKDFIKIAEYITKKRLRLCILTNGQKLYDDNALFEKLVSIYPAYVQFSLYSMNPNIHDNLTGVKGSHFKTVNVIKKLRKRNINVTITCFQTSYNPNSFSEVEEFANSINADFFTECRFQYNPKNKNFEAKLSKKDMVDFYVKTIDLDNPRGNIIKCSGGHDRLAVMPNLEVNPCNYCYFSVGNLNSMTLQEARKNAIKNFKEKITKENLKDCYKYDYCEYCRYCSIFTCYTKDNFLKKSEILCEDAQAYQEALSIRKKQLQI